jgi:hypothetical protein
MSPSSPYHSSGSPGQECGRLHRPQALRTTTFATGSGPGIFAAGGRCYLRTSGLRRPEFLLIVDGARSTSHRNLLAHASERLHEADQRHDLCGDARGDRPAAQVPSSANGGSSTVPSPTACRRVAIGCSPSRGCRQVSGTASAPPMPSSACRGAQASDQEADRAAIGGHGGDVVLGTARFRSDQHAQGRWLASTRHQAHRPAN